MPLIQDFYEDDIYKSLPEYMRFGMKAWIVEGVVPGDFLSAVLKNDLMKACAHADSVNRILLHKYAEWLYSYAPTNCYGSEANFNKWEGLNREYPHHKPLAEYVRICESEDHDMWSRVDCAPSGEE